jgi:hypothetical protein
VLPRRWFGFYMLGSIRPSFFFLALKQHSKLGVPIYKKRLNRQNGVPYTLTIKKMTNGLLSESSSTMILPLGTKIGLGTLIPLYICCIRL